MTKYNLNNHIPAKSTSTINQLIDKNNVELKLVNERVTRHGDYRKLPNGKHRITINKNLNEYRFLITLVHEIAHLEAFKSYGKLIKPHGKEWKHTFQRLMLPLLNPEIFPAVLLPKVAVHFKNPKASSDTDSILSLALKQYDPPNDKSFIFEIPMGEKFRLYNGRVFERGKKRVKRFECLELATGRMYLFNPNAEVEYINSL
jgi:hypothetical protein